MSDLRAIDQARTTRRQTIEAVYAALAAGDEARLAELLHDDIEATFADGLPLGIGGTHHGRAAAIERGWWAIGRAFDVEAVPARWLEDGPDTVVVGAYQGTARSTGRALNTAFCHTWTMRGARVERLVQITDAAEWCAALQRSGDDKARFALDRATGVASIELLDAAGHNRIDVALGKAIASAIAQAEASAARCILVHARGRDFTVGGDIQHFISELANLADSFDTMIGPYHAALAELGSVGAPVVCAVQGAAAGGGLGLLWASDVVIAADDLKLTTGFTKLGISGDGGSTWALPRLVGLRKALQLSFSSPVLDAEQALDAGLVDRVVPAAELLDIARAEAERLARGPTVAYGHLRRLLRESTANSWADQLQAERVAIVDCARTTDACEGIRAFAERRTPTFGGRR